MSLATIAPRQALDAAVVFEFVSRVARTVQDPEVQKAAGAIILAVGAAITTVTEFGPVWTRVWRQG